METENKLRRLLPFIAVGLLVVVTVSVALALALGGKGKNEGEDTQEIEITYWGFTVQNSTMEELIARFEEANPGITINYEKKAVDDYHKILKARLESEDANVIPDVFETNNEYINTVLPYLDSQSASLSGAVTPQEIYQTYFPAGAKVCAQSSLVLCIPLNFDGLVMVYNESALSAKGMDIIPENWSDFKLWTDRLTERRVVGSGRSETVVIDRAGAAIGTAGNVSNSYMLLWLMMMQNEVLINEPGNPKEMASLNAVAAAELYVSFFLDKIWDNSFGLDRDEFLLGRVPVFFGTVDDVKYVFSQEPGFRVRTVPPPQISSQTNIAHFQVVAVSKQAASSEAAWKWANYLGSSDAQKIVFEQSGELPSRRDLQFDISTAEGMNGFEAIFLTAEPVFFEDYEAVATSTSATIGAMSLDSKPMSAVRALEELVKNLPKR